MNYSLYAPAKINLHLEVGPVRADGYHDLRTIFHMVDFCDYLELQVSEQGGGFALQPEFTFPKEENLIYKAYSAFMNLVKKKGMEYQGKTFSFTCHKQIPAGGGLGGGSSDGAATLRLLNHALDHPLKMEELIAIASKLGSDVPFFLGEVAALGLDRGEQLHPIRPLLSKHLLLVFPSWQVSTAHAYALIDTKGRACWADGAPDRDALSRDPWTLLREKALFNDFTLVLSDLYPEIETVFRIFQDGGSCFWEMSGSGSTLFGFFESIGELKDAEKRLKQLGFATREVKMLAKQYKPVYNG
jgi:4-diphosphocytidyl-2-C-methyl-D-erythritol kinase